jgi:hypothetical protein
MCSVYNPDSFEFQSSGSFRPPTPQIKSWTLFGPSQSMGFFDFSGAKELFFSCLGPSDDFRMAFLSSQLTKLVLKDLEWDPDTLSGYESHLMPQLIELRLINFGIEGRFQDFLQCPKLKRLYLDRAEFFTPKKAEEDDEITLIETLLSHSISFRSLPELEGLYVRRGHLDGGVVGALQSCPLLQHLATDWCDIEEFIPSFTTAISDIKNFPALKSLCIDNSWRAEEPWSRKEFAGYCAGQRAGLTVSSNDMGLGVVSQMA